MPLTRDEALDGHLFGADQPCFGCGPHHPIGLHLRFVRSGEDEIHTRWTPDERFQGPPGITHGGIAMTLADEVAAWALIGTRGLFGFTTSVELKLRSALRIHEEIAASGRIESQTKRTAAVRVTLKQGDRVGLEGLIHFAILSEAGAERLLGQPLPDAWRRFARSE